MIPMLMVPPPGPAQAPMPGESAAGSGFEALLGEALSGSTVGGAAPQVLCVECAATEGVLSDSSEALLPEAAGELAVVAVVLPPAAITAKSETPTTPAFTDQASPEPLACEECSVALVAPVPPAPPPTTVPYVAAPAAKVTTVADQPAEAETPMLTGQAPAVSTEAVESTATTQAPTSTRFAERVERIVAQLELAGPPKSIVVDLQEFSGARITVSLRGNAVHLAFAGAPPGELGDWLPELRRVLADRGLDFRSDARDGDDDLTEDEHNSRRKPSDRQHRQ
jgi:hypothetical protein